MTEMNGEETTVPQRRTPPLARLVGRRPKRGAADAAKDVVADVQTLVKAEIALAKAEVLEGVKAKAMGAGFFIVVAVIGWLFIQAFLVFLGFVFGTFLPPWAAAGMVVLLLLIMMAVLGFLGYRKLQTEISTKVGAESREESQRVAQAAVEQAQENTKEGVEEAKRTLAETFEDVKARLQALRGSRNGSSTAADDDQPGSLAATAGVGGAAVTPLAETAAPAAPTPAVAKTPTAAAPTPAMVETPAPAVTPAAAETPSPAPADAVAAVDLGKGATPSSTQGADASADTTEELEVGPPDALPTPPERPDRPARPPGSTWNPQPRPTQDDELG